MLWERLDSQYIVKIFELLDDGTHPLMYLIMQYSDYGQLASWDSSTQQFVRNEKIFAKALEAAELKYLEDYSDVEKVAKHIFRQVAEGVKYLHEEKQMAHRDIKLENILYLSDGDRVKITDFTVAVLVPNEEFTIKDHEGTKAFEAAECNTAEEFKPKPLDIWALGVSMYAYVTLKLPFYAEVESELNE